MATQSDSPVKESVPEMVARRILDMVKSGGLKSGEALPPERDLAASWNVSPDALPPRATVAAHARMKNICQSTVAQNVRQSDT